MEIKQRTRLHSQKLGHLWWSKQILVLQVFEIFDPCDDDHNPSMLGYWRDAKLEDITTRGETK